MADPHGEPTPLHDHDAVVLEHQCELHHSFIVPYGRQFYEFWRDGRRRRTEIYSDETLEYRTCSHCNQIFQSPTSLVMRMVTDDSISKIMENPISYIMRAAL